MRRDELKQRVIALAVILAPLALVKVAGSLMSGPAPAGAAVVIEPPLVEVPAAREVPACTEDMLRAGERMRELRQLPFGESPLYFAPRAAPPKPVDHQIEADPVATETFELTSIMSSPRGSLAVIDGRVCREGDMIPGHDWIVQRIDAIGHRVTLAQPSSKKTLILQVQSGR